MASLIESLAAGFAAAPSGYAYFYTPGTTTQAAVYDEDLVVQSQPVALDAYGAARIYTTARRRMLVQTAAGVTVADMDPAGSERAEEVELSNAYATDTNLDSHISTVGASFGAADGKVLPAGTTSLTLKEALGRMGVLGELFGITADGSTDDTAALQSAVNYVSAQKTRPWLLLPRGTIKITALVTVTYDATTAPYAPRIKGGGTAAETAGSGNGTVIKNHGTSTGALQFIGAFPDPVQLEDFQITCNTASTGKAIETQNTSLHLIASTIAVDDHDIGIEVAGTTRLIDCTSTTTANAAGRALLIDGAATRVSVIGGSYTTGGHTSAIAISVTANAAFVSVVGSLLGSDGTLFYTSGTGAHSIVACTLGYLALTTFQTASACMFTESGCVGSTSAFVPIIVMHASAIVDISLLKFGTQATVTSADLTPDLTKGAEFRWTVDTNANQALVIPASTSDFFKRRGNSFKIIVKNTNGANRTITPATGYKPTTAITIVAGETNVIVYSWDSVASAWRLTSNTASTT